MNYVLKREHLLERQQQLLFRAILSRYTGSKVVSLTHDELLALVNYQGVWLADPTRNNPTGGVWVCLPPGVVERYHLKNNVPVQVSPDSRRWFEHGFAHWSDSNPNFRIYGVGSLRKAFEQDWHGVTTKEERDYLKGRVPPLERQKFYQRLRIVDDKPKK